jgi:hypothetical protein
LASKLDEQKHSLKEISSSHQKQINSYQSRIHILKMQTRRLHESTHKKIDEQDRVIHTHIYIQTLLHKQHTHTSHDVRRLQPWFRKAWTRMRRWKPWWRIRGSKHGVVKRPRCQMRNGTKDVNPRSVIFKRNFDDFMSRQIKHSMRNSRWSKHTSTSRLSCTNNTLIPHTTLGDSILN